MSNSLRPHGLYSPWNSPGQNTGVGSLSLLQGIFPTQGSNQVSHITGGFFTSWATREAGEGVEKREASYTVGGNVNWYNQYGGHVWKFLKKLNIELLYNAAIPLLGVKHMYPDVHCSTNNNFITVFAMNWAVSLNSYVQAVTRNVTVFGALAFWR